MWPAGWNLVKLEKFGLWSQNQSKQKNKMDSHTITKLLLIAQSLITCSDAYPQGDSAGTLYSHPTMNTGRDLFTEQSGLRVNEVEWGTSTSSYGDTAGGEDQPTSRVKLFMEQSNNARFYANHEGAHCVYSWYDDARNLTSTCGLGCKLNVQALNPIHNGKVPQTGIYVRAKLEEPGALSLSNIDTSYSENGFSQGFRSDRTSIVKCNNEFGCHANDMVDPDDINNYKSGGSGLGYAINTTVHDAMTGVRTVQPHGKHGASPALVRKSVCKCNMGFTAPLQLKSMWCGNECPGPDCALQTKRTESMKPVVEEFCDDIIDGTKETNGRCSTLNQESLFRSKGSYKNGKIPSDRDSSYMENFHAEQSETRHGGLSSVDVGQDCYDRDGNPQHECMDKIFNYKLMNNMDISESNLKSVLKGTAYNYYTSSERYAESDKYDDIAKELYQTLLTPLEKDSIFFSNLSQKDKKAKMTSLKRFACRHTYPACAPCSDLAAATRQTSSDSREIFTDKPRGEDISVTTKSTPKPINVINWSLKKQAIRQNQWISPKQAMELSGFPEKSDNGCLGAPNAPLTFPQATGYYPDAIGAVDRNGVTPGYPHKVPAEYLKTQERSAEIDIYNWYETEKIRKGKNSPSYYYCRAKTGPKCDKSSTKAECLECYVVKSGYSSETNYKNACIHSWATLDDVKWNVVTIRNSQAPWFTCFAQDQCRQDCRAAFSHLNSTHTLNNQQTNSFITAWYNGLRDHGGSHASGWTGLGDSILDNVVSPKTESYPDDSFFPRSLHYLYGLYDQMINNGGGAGHRDLGTFRTTGHPNRTLIDAIAAVFNPSTTLINNMTEQSLINCPDDQWCSPYRKTNEPFDLARFCALPEICPIRTHHFTPSETVPPIIYNDESRGVMLKGVSVAWLMFVCGIVWMM